MRRFSFPGVAVKRRVHLPSRWSHRWRTAATLGGGDEPLARLWEQGLRDQAHAEHALDDSDYEWAAFAAQQAAEKVLKALILSRGGEPWGHSITSLVESLPPEVGTPPEIVEAANRLDKHYIPSRYPNGFDSGYPGKLYTRGESEGAIADAKRIVEFCRRHLPRPEPAD